MLNFLDIDVEIFFLFEKLPQLVLVFQLVSDERVKLLGCSIFNELDFVNVYVLSYSSFVIRDLLSRVTLNESLSRSGLSLNNLHNFLVLSFNMIDRFAI